MLFICSPIFDIYGLVVNLAGVFCTFFLRGIYTLGNPPWGYWKIGWFLPNPCFWKLMGLEDDWQYWHVRLKNGSFSGRFIRSVSGGTVSVSPMTLPIWQGRGPAFCRPQLPRFHSCLGFHPNECLGNSRVVKAEDDDVWGGVVKQLHWRVVIYIKYTGSGIYTILYMFIYI